MSDAILESREKRFEDIKRLSHNNQIVICIKANTPGIDKNRYSSFFLVDHFAHLISKKFDILDTHKFESSDGSYTIFIVQSTAIDDLKKALINIENRHALGRLIDLDLYMNQQLISREDYNISQRNCMLCEHNAIYCMKNKSHSTEELLSFIDYKIYEYIENNISDMIEKALLLELNLEDKFGLVTPSSTGSHTDMNYDLMLKSKDIIKPYLLDILKLGFLSDTKDLYQKARAIGLKAEIEMFKQTEQINTYKGLIYILGFVLLSIGYIIKNNLGSQHIFSRIKSLAIDVFEDFDKPVQTAGVDSYMKYKITGIRGEVFNGLPTIQKAQKTFLHIDTFDKKHYHHLLLFFMIHCEDTVLLKRAGNLKNYQHFKQMAAQVNPYIDKDIKKFTSYCINHHISIGGSADLFIVFYFLNYFNIFYHKEQK